MKENNSAAGSCGRHCCVYRDAHNYTLYIPVANCSICLLPFV